GLALSGRGGPKDQWRYERTVGRTHSGRSMRATRQCLSWHCSSACGRLLRARRERPCECRAAEKRHELATLHSITSSARASNVGGTVRPSAFAVLRLITSSYLVGACTGRSAGFSPFKMRLT